MTRTPEQRPTIHWTHDDRTAYPVKDSDDYLVFQYGALRPPTDMEWTVIRGRQHQIRTYVVIEDDSKAQRDMLRSGK